MLPEGTEIRAKCFRTKPKHITDYEPIKKELFTIATSAVKQIYEERNFQMVALNQLGYDLPCFVMRTGEIIIDPVVVWQDKAVLAATTNLYPFKDIYVMTYRVKSIKITYHTFQKGELVKMTKRFKSPHSIFVQQGIEAINGIILLDKGIAVPEVVKDDERKVYRITDKEFFFDYFVEGENKRLFLGTHISPDAFPDKKAIGIKKTIQ